jgi:Flp pilus assembly protein TadB
MPDDQLRTDEDVEGILRLAVQQTSVDSADLRSRLNLSAAELGISEEHLRLAESQYFEEKEAEKLRAERESSIKEELARERKQRLGRFFSILGVAAAVVALIAFMKLPGGHSGGTVMLFLIPFMIFRRVRSDRRDSLRGFDGWSEEDSSK